MADKNEDSFEINLKEAIPSKNYKLRPTGDKENSSIETTIPRQVIEREAKQRDLSIEKFIEKYRAIWYANSFDGLHLQFEEKGGGSE